MVFLVSRSIGRWTVPVMGVSAVPLLRLAQVELARYLLGFVAFTAARHLADDLGPAPFVAYPIMVDRILGFGVTPTEWMQTNLPDLTPAAAMVYGSYFFTPFLAGVLWRCWPDRLRPYVTATLLLFAFAAVVHLVVPTAPPWMAADLGLLPGVRPLVLEYYEVSLPAVYAAGVGVSSNPVAAMPSVHVGVTVLLVCALWPTVLRWPAMLYAGLMAATVTLSGDHYVCDWLLGGLLGAGCWRYARAR
jgi:hypothetical protein